MLLYADNNLAIAEEPEIFLREELVKKFTLKENSIGSPEKCLGNKGLKFTPDFVSNAGALAHLNILNLPSRTQKTIAQDLILVPFSRLNRTGLVIIVRKMIFLLS